MKQLKWAARHRPRALTTLLGIGMLVTAASLIFSATSVNHIRGDFCDWAIVHYRAAQKLRPTPTVVADTKADKQLTERLGCK